MSVLGKCSTEMSAIHLIKTYCLPTILYGCEVWTLTDSSLHRISVAWNNCFRLVFGCCWRESVKPLQYFCNTLPVSSITDSRRLIFCRSLRVSENPVVRTLVHLNYNNSVAIASEYGLDNYMMDVKCTVWQSFSRSLLYV